MSAWTELPTAAKLVAWAEQRQPWDRDEVTMATGLLRQAAIELNSVAALADEMREFLDAAEYEGLAALWSNGDLWMNSLRAALATAGVPERKEPVCNCSAEAWARVSGRMPSIAAIGCPVHDRKAAKQ